MFHGELRNNSTQDIPMLDTHMEMTNRKSWEILTYNLIIARSDGEQQKSRRSLLGMCGYIEKCLRMYNKKHFMKYSCDLFSLFDI